MDGRERDSSKGQVVRRARVHRSWNGGRIDGQQTLTESQFWGFPNHTLEASGTGGVISYNTFLNGQDSIFLKNRPFDDLTVEHNIFVNSSYFTVSNDGRGGTTPSIGWRFRYNILTGIVFDEKAYATVEADCNLYVPNGRNVDSDANRGLRRGTATSRMPPLIRSAPEPRSTDARSRCRPRSGGTGRSSGSMRVSRRLTTTSAP